MADRLEFSLLGTPEVHMDGLPVTGFNSNKVFSLLCYLAVTREIRLRPYLAGMFWGNLPEANAKNNLRKALTNLRKVVGRHVLITRQSVAFNQDSNYWLDVIDFEAKAGEENPEKEIQQLEAAMKLYRGDFLAGFHLHQAPEFENWVLIQRARLRALAVKALHALSIYYTRLGERSYPIAIEYVKQLLTLEPYQEEAHRQLMLLFALNGQRSAAISQYKTCSQILMDELDVPPGADTQRLFEQIRDDRLEPILPLPRFLTQGGEDPESPLFVGRQHELALLGNSLQAACNRRGQILFITGGPGRGKTALLDAFVQQSIAVHPGLLAAKGKCSSYAGIGDPYAPFREILGMLTGDVETQWRAGAISTHQAQR
jgi:DNA-binding SARP family transcriptional activator